MSRAREVGDLGSVVTVDDGKVGIGTSSLTTKLNIAGANVADIQYRSTRQEVPPSSSRTIYSAIGGAYSTGTTEVNSAFISFATDAPWSSTSAPSRIVFGTTPSGSTTSAERARFTSDGYLRMASGSGGIQFGGDTAAANALDDYEEGTFTPEFADATTGGTAHAGTGTYTKIGRVVTMTVGFANINTTGMTSGNAIRIRNLPFVLAEDVFASPFVDRFNFTNYIVISGASGSSYVNVGDMIDSAQDVLLTVAAVTASGGSDFYFTMTYQTS